MTQYVHTMSIIVPQVLIAQANQLALIAGESYADVYTFDQADWADLNGNLYALCSTVVKPIVLNMIMQPLSSSDAPLTSDAADSVMAQQALDSVVMYEQDLLLTNSNITVVIDVELAMVLSSLGLSPIYDMDDF